MVNVSEGGQFRRAIQSLATEAIVNVKPVSIVYGRVTSEEPLEIWLNQAITLDNEHLVLSRNVTDYEIEEEVSWKSENDGVHTHELIREKCVHCEECGKCEEPEPCEVVISGAHKHSIVGVKKVKVLNGLKVGEMVSLVQFQGGQKFLVLDRIVGV